jgi:hypothetical protein
MGIEYDATVFPGGVVIANRQVAEWLVTVRLLVGNEDGMLDLMAVLTDVLFGNGRAPACIARNRVHELYRLERDAMLSIWEDGTVIVDTAFEVFARELNAQNRLYQRLKTALFNGDSFAGGLHLDLSGFQSSTGIYEDEVAQLLWELTVPPAVQAFLRSL